MKRMGQIVLLIAVALLAAQPVLAELPAGMSCGQSMADCAPKTACCGSETAALGNGTTPPVLAQQSMPCHPESCFFPTPQKDAILVATSTFKWTCISTVQWATPPAPEVSATLLHRPPHPNASTPSLSILFRVFRI